MGKCRRHQNDARSRGDLHSCKHWRSFAMHLAQVISHFMLVPGEEGGALLRKDIRLSDWSSALSREPRSSRPRCHDPMHQSDDETGHSTGAYDPARTSRLCRERFGSEPTEARDSALAPTGEMRRLRRWAFRRVGYLPASSAAHDCFLLQCVNGFA